MIKRGVFSQIRKTCHLYLVNYLRYFVYCTENSISQFTKLFLFGLYVTLTPGNEIAVGSWFNAHVQDSVFSCSDKSEFSYCRTLEVATVTVKQHSHA